VRPAFDGTLTKEVRRFFDRYATVSFENYPVGELRDAPRPTGGR
jgi:formylmethanofuran dehydrogenase subunit A